MEQKFGRVESPKKTFFYQRPDGSIFACHLSEAFQCHTKFKQVGVSDGIAYATKLSRIDKSLPIENIQDKMREAFNEEIEIARGHFENPVIEQNVAGVKVGMTREGVVHFKQDNA